jgi:hypothetical protein
MKERPILFSAPMVRATLAGTKTQTRRVAKPVKHPDLGNIYTPGALVMEREPQHVIERACPYGQPGDRLWVRESFDFLPCQSLDNPAACEIVYWATGSTESRTAPSDYNPLIYGREKIRPSIHMPRWASRITLEVTGVRVERLQGISEADAAAEGVERGEDFRGWYRGPLPGDSKGLQESGRSFKIPTAFAKLAYRALWESINGPGSWDENPWVWVVEFKRLEGGAA